MGELKDNNPFLVQLLNNFNQYRRTENGVFGQKSG